MCCCIPLRRLSYVGSLVHIGIGLYYFYLMGAVGYYLFEISRDDYSKELTLMGFLYIGYYATFLPPGVFIFLGIHKKIRRFLVLPPIIFLIVIGYGVGLESVYGYRPARLHVAIQLMGLKAADNKIQLALLRSGFWMDIFTRIALTLTYLFMLFFYYREIGPESTPVPSRYRQAYQAASQAACGQQGMMVGSPGSHSVGGPRFGGPGSVVGNPHDGQGQGGHMGPRTFRPLNVMGNDTTSSHLVQNTFIPPFNMPNQGGGGGGGGPGGNDSGGGGGVSRSNAHFIRSANPVGVLDLASFPNLTLEQQRELAILQAHPLLSQQHSQQQFHPQHLQQLLSSQDPRLLEFLQAQAAAQSKKNLY